MILHIYLKIETNHCKQAAAANMLTQININGRTTIYELLEMGFAHFAINDKGITLLDYHVQLKKNMLLQAALSQFNVCCLIKFV